ncbi:Kinase D-interacting substrate [Schistosoma japonicum]|uniref:Kinase D-interacting substrate n=1 Tax=Schistosoma japonicum TaxID=6182 RepID=A0A4Z2D4C5_SCHJA|nr:Kinase D-interacting substrate [Schistosoma japonicum]
MHHSHLHSTMAHTSQRFPQQNTIHDQMKHPHHHHHHYHRREQSSESITSTSRDFNTNHVKKYDSNYPQKQLTRKPRPFTYNEKQNSQSREHSITRQYPYGYLHNIKDNQRKQLTTKEQMYYHKKLSDIQCTNESSGSTSNPNRNELNNHQHLHHLPMTTDDSHLHKCEQIQNRLHQMNQKREIYDTRLMQSVGSICCQPKKSNLDEIVGLAANDCHMFSYHPYGFSSSNERSTDWNSPKPQMSTSYTTDSTVGNKFIGQQCQFGLNTLESFQQGCLTSLASMLLCPHTILPIMVGLFSNVGSSTDYVQKLGEELVYLKQSNPYYYDQTRIEFGFWPGILPLIIVSILGYILGLSLGWQLGFAVAITATLLYAIFFGVIICGVRIKQWSKTIELAETISRYMRGCNLLFNILFYRSPQAPRIAQPVRLLPISINLSNFSTSTEAAVHLAEKIWISIEHKYGRLPVRLQWASRDVYGDSTKTYRKVCCLPSCIWVFVNVITLLTMATLIAIDNSFSLTENKYGTTTTTTTGSGSSSSSSNPTPKIDGDVNTLTENFKVFIIICAVICGLSFLILIAAITPGIVKLIRGRPFQHPIKKPFYPDLESYTDITLDSCYGNGIRKLYPVSNCIESNQRDTTCFTHGAYYNHGSRQMLESTNKLTSAVSMAAAAAAAAVTAADHHWRQSGNSKYFNHHSQQMYERGQLKSKYECDLEDGLNGINPKIDTNSNGHDYEDDDDDDEDSSEESKQSDSNEHSTIEDEESSRTDGLLFNSGELLLNGQSIPNSNHGKLNKKHFLSTHDKQYSKSTRNQQRKTVNIERKKNEQLLRQYVLDACSVLSMLDRRVGGRQTRLILCINGINGTIENSITNKKLLDFMHLLDHILMKPPTGGKSYDVPLILAPIGSPEKVANNIPSTVWVPNAVMIIAANISGINNDNAKMSNFDSVGRNDYNQMHRISSTLRMSLTNSSIGSNPKIWYCIHQLCHLPIYIEDEPFGFKVFDQTNEQSFISPTRSASNIYHHMKRLKYLSQNL